MTHFVRFQIADEEGLGVLEANDTVRGLLISDLRVPGDLQQLIAQGGASLQTAAIALAGAPQFDRQSLRLLPPIAKPGKIICIGLNYVDHSLETGFSPPEFPTIFARWANSIVGCDEPLVRPKISDHFDFEGEIAAIIGKPCSKVSAKNALDYVAGYSLFNDGSIRDYQFKSPQWTIGKSFDNSGAFGPAFVTADELPSGLGGLQLHTRLNGELVQTASTDDMIFDVPTLIEIISAAVTLEPGDVIATGTPAGVGMARTPQLWMKPGDVCEITVKGIGVLRNPIIQG